MEGPQNSGTHISEAHLNQAHPGEASSVGAHVVEYRIFFIVWVCLLALTGLTIWVAGLGLGNFSTFVAMGIATIKASLVLFFFMHLRYEPPLFRIMALVTIITLTVIVLLTFTDIWFR